MWKDVRRAKDGVEWELSLLDMGKDVRMSCDVMCDVCDVCEGYIHILTVRVVLCGTGRWRGLHRECRVDGGRPV